MSQITQITTELVNLYNDSIELPKNTQESVESYKKQVEYEDLLMTSNRICHPSGRGSLMGISAADVDKSNLNVLLDYIQNNFYDRSVMETFRCMLNSFIDIENGESESERGRINKFIEHLKRFGTPSAYGFPLRGQIRTTSTGHELKGDIIVIKCPREPSNSKELIHELCVGLNGTNKLRDPNTDGTPGVPFFAYLFDAFYCSTPIVNDENKEVVEWCMAGENPVAYVIYENINDAFGIGELTSRKDEKTIHDFILAMILSAVGIKHAEETVGFTHCDLHDENILFRLVSNGIMSIPLPYNGKTKYFLSSERIPTFIDYGMSRITTSDGTNIGKLDSSGVFKNVGISVNETNGIADMHKLLCFMLRKAFIANNPVFADVTFSLLGYFYGTNSTTYPDMLDLITYQFPFRYNFPPSYGRSKGWNLGDLIEHMCEIYETFFGRNAYYSVKPEGIPVFGVDTKIITPLVVKEAVIPKDTSIPSFFSLANTEQGRDILVAKIKEHWDSISSIENGELDRYCVDNLNLTLLNIPLNKEIFNEHKDACKQSAITIATELNYLSKLSELNNIYVKIAPLFSDGRIKYFIDKSYKYINKYLRDLISIKDGINTGFLFLEKLIFGKELGHYMTPEEFEFASNSEYFEIYSKYDEIVKIIKAYNM